MIINSTKIYSKRSCSFTNLGRVGATLSSIADSRSLKKVVSSAWSYDIFLMLFGLLRLFFLCFMRGGVFESMLLITPERGVEGADLLSSGGEIMMMCSWGMMIGIVYELYQNIFRIGDLSEIYRIVSEKLFLIHRSIKKFFYYTLSSFNISYSNFHLYAYLLLYSFFPV